MNRSALSLAVVLSAAVSPASARPPVPPATQIERGLRSAVVIRGTPVPTRTIADEMRRLHVPGVSVAVLRDGRIAWAKGYGVTRTGGAAITPATLFQAGSISKPVTALAALRLVQQGRLTLDGDVNRVLKGWTLPTPAGTSVTLRQLLSHTAGVTVHGFPGYATGEPVPSVDDILAGRPLANTKPVVVDTPPGSAWRYSGGGYTVVQKLIGDVTGRPFAQVVRQEVLAPAGMTRSRFDQPLPPALLADAAWPHDGGGAPIAGGPHRYPELAAAGLWSTPSDLARFAIAVRATKVRAPGALLGPALAAAMLTPGKGNYGLGLEILGPADNRSFAHGGSNAGYENFLIAYAGTGDGAVVMTNGAQGNELSGEIVRSIAAAYGWPSYRSIERAAVPTPVALRKARAGEYAIAGLGSFVIADTPGGLTLSLKEGASEPLHAMDDRAYFILSQDLIVRFDGDTSATTGRIMSGPFDLAFSKVP